MKVAAPFSLEFTERRNAKLQVVFVRAIRIVRLWDGTYSYRNVRDWCAQILFWRPKVGTN